MQMVSAEPVSRPLESEFEERQARLQRCLEGSETLLHLSLMNYDDALLYV
jgi:hypothetical protein